MSGAGWVCPTCRRRFAKAKQWHSCKRQTVESHFAGKDPALRRLFDFLVGELEKTGPLRVDAVKTSINLISRHHFGGIAVRKEYLRIGFLAQRRIESSRIVRHEVVGPNRVAHFVEVSRKAHIDAQLRRWLSAAQRVQS